MKEEKFLNILGEKIKNGRKAKRLTQQQLSELCGLKRSYICDIERGQRNASINSLLKIFKVLKINICLEYE